MQTETSEPRIGSEEYSDENYLERRNFSSLCEEPEESEESEEEFCCDDEWDLWGCSEEDDCFWD